MIFALHTGCPRKYENMSFLYQEAQNVKLALKTTLLQHRQGQRIQLQTLKW